MNKAKIIGWVLSALLGVMLIVLSAGGKFMDFPGKEEMLASQGFSSELLFKIGILEVIITLLFLIPRSAFFGAVLLTAYLGGATVTHVRIGEAFVIPVVIGVLVWISLGLRQPEVFRVAFGLKTPAKDSNFSGPTT